MVCFCLAGEEDGSLWRLASSSQVKKQTWLANSFIDFPIYFCLPSSVRGGGLQNRGCFCTAKLSFRRVFSARKLRLKRESMVRRRWRTGRPVVLVCCAHPSTEGAALGSSGDVFSTLVVLPPIAKGYHDHVMTNPWRNVAGEGNEAAPAGVSAAAAVQRNERHQMICPCLILISHSTFSRQFCR